MEHRQLGSSGLRVPVLGLGTATFGGGSDFFRAWGATDTAAAARLLDVCIDAGAAFVDTANVYSAGLAEEILGEAMKGRRDRLIVATKSTAPVGSGPNDAGSSRQSIIRECEASLRRLQTDHIDLYYMHTVDELTPVEETIDTLDALVTAGKVRYTACSNFSASHLMRSVATSDRHGRARYVANQLLYSLVVRDIEWELLPLARQEGVGTIAYSALAGGSLTGKVRRGSPPPEGTRLAQLPQRMAVPEEQLHTIVDVLEEISHEVGRSITQVALNWVLHRPTVASVVIGARDEEQLVHNLGAAGWRLTDEQAARLDEASAVPPPYPAWQHRFFPMLHP